MEVAGSDAAKKAGYTVVLNGNEIFTSIVTEWRKAT